MRNPGAEGYRRPSRVNLPSGIRIFQAFLENEEPGVFFEIERNGNYISFNLPEPEALSVALAILGVSIDMRDTGGPRWRPRLIKGR